MAGAAYLHETAVLRFLAEHGPCQLGWFRSRAYSISETGGTSAALRCLGHGWLVKQDDGRYALTDKGRKELKLRTS